MRGTGMYRDIHVHMYVTRSEMRSLITQPPFLAQSTGFDLSFSNINTEQSTHLDRQSLLKQAALLPAWAENKTANDTRQLLALLLKPQPLDVMAESTVQGPLQNRITLVSVFRNPSRASPSCSSSHSTLHCRLPLETGISLLNSPWKNKKGGWGRTHGKRMEPTMAWYLCLVFCLFAKYCPPLPHTDSRLYEGGDCCLLQPSQSTQPQHVRQPTGDWSWLNLSLIP